MIEISKFLIRFSDAIKHYHFGLVDHSPRRQSHMAQQTDQRQVIVLVGDDFESQSKSQPQKKLFDVPVLESLEKECSKVSVPSSSVDPELTRPQQKDLSSSKHGLEETRKNEEMMGSRSQDTAQQSKLFLKRSKSRLDDAKWGHSWDDDEDWFMDEDVLEGFRPKKCSLLTIFQLVCLVLVIKLLVCTLSIRSLKKFKLWDLSLWKWEILISVVISGHLVSGWVVRIIVFVTENAFVLTNMRVLYFVYGMRKAVQHCIWLVLILTAWHFLVAAKIEMETKSKVLPRVSKVLLCLFVGSLVWLVKVFIVKVLASSFYNKTFFERAKEYLFNQYVIKKLSGSPRRDEQGEGEVAVWGESRLKSLPQFLRQFSKRRHQMSSKARWRKLARKRASALLLKRFVGILQSGLLHGLSTLDENLPDSSDDEDDKSLNSKAEKAARKIFWAIAGESDVIVLGDLEKYMRADKASLAMRLFEGTAETGVIAEKSFINWMIGAIKQRRFLQLSLSDAKTAVDELHHLLDAIVAFIIVIIWLVIFELAVGHLIVVVSSQLLLVGFIFQNTVKTVFEAIIFLFIMHPFDVGDRCEVDEVQMVVEEMNILTTAFERYDGQKVMYPNSVLATKPIGNYNRSTDMGDQIQFSIHISTPWEKVVTMKERIKSYIEGKDKHWHREPMILVKDVEDMNRLMMVVWPRHRMNHQQMGERWLRRASLVDEMIKIFRELQVEYRMLPLDMNVRNMPDATTKKLPSIWSTCLG